MNSVWDNMYDSFKDRRYAALFLITLCALVLSPILLPVMGLYILAQGWSAFWMDRASRRNKMRYAPLSRDELRVARSKLMKGQSLKKT